MVWASPDQNIVDFHLKYNRESEELGLGQPRQKLVDFHLNSDGKAKEIDLGQPKAESG